MSRQRVALGTAGILLAVFGIFRLVTQVAISDLVVLAFWLVGALVIHDGILSPFVIGIGAMLNRVVPARARRYITMALIAGACVTVIAIPMIYRRDSQPRSKAILQQNFGGNLAVLLGGIAAISLIAYAVRVARDYRSKDPQAGD